VSLRESSLRKQGLSTRIGRLEKGIARRCFGAKKRTMRQWGGQKHGKVNVGNKKVIHDALGTGLGSRKQNPHGVKITEGRRLV